MTQFYEFNLRLDNGGKGRSIWLNPDHVAAVDGGHEGHCLVTLASGAACNIIGECWQVAAQLSADPE